MSLGIIRFLYRFAFQRLQQTRYAVAAWYSFLNHHHDRLRFNLTFRSLHFSSRKKRICLHRKVPGLKPEIQNSPVQKLFPPPLGAYLNFKFISNLRTTKKIYSLLFLDRHTRSFEIVKADNVKGWKNSKNRNSISLWQINYVEHETSEKINDWNLVSRRKFLSFSTLLRVWLFPWSSLTDWLTISLFHFPILLFIYKHDFLLSK